MKTNFDNYLEEQLRDPGFRERFEKAGEAWDIAVQLSALREEQGLRTASAPASSRSAASNRHPTKAIRSPCCERWPKRWEAVYT